MKKFLSLFLKAAAQQRPTGQFFFFSFAAAQQRPTEQNIIMEYLQIQIKDDGIIFSGWHNYPTRYNIEYLTNEQLQALIHRIEYDLFPFIQGRHEGCKLRFRIVNLKDK